MGKVKMRRIIMGIDVVCGLLFAMGRREVGKRVYGVDRGFLRRTGIVLLFARVKWRLRRLFYR